MQQWSEMQENKKKRCCVWNQSMRNSINICIKMRTKHFRQTSGKKYSIDRWLYVEQCLVRQIWWMRDLQFALKSSNCEVTADKTDCADVWKGIVSFWWRLKLHLQYEYYLFFKGTLCDILITLFADKTTFLLDTKHCLFCSGRSRNGHGWGTNWFKANIWLEFRPNLHVNEQEMSKFKAVSKCKHYSLSFWRRFGHCSLFSSEITQYLCAYITQESFIEINKTNELRKWLGLLHFWVRGNHRSEAKGEQLTINTFHCNCL